MTLGVARAATSPELALYRTPGKAAKWRAAIFQPTTVYTARINQTFTTTDGVLEITYDTGSGVLGGVLPDMTLLVGSTAGAWDKGICRIRDKDATKFYIGETSDILWADNLYLTVVNDYGLWARHVLISSGVSYMDGGIAYSDQHANPDPTPIMGSNRVLKLTGATVSTQFDGSASYVVGGLSSISSYLWSCASASASSGTTTATPTFTFDSIGWHLIFLTATAANTKSFYGVRYVYVWDDDNPPPRAQIGTPRQDVETGGWEFELTLIDECDLDTIRDHALVILFNEDYFGGTQSDIGPVAGAENIEVEGWIAKESINWNPEQGFVRFSAYTAHYWFGQIPAFPDGVEFTTSTPSAWTEFQDLTVPKGVWHFIHWRTTATRIMDVFLPDDTKYTKEVSSLASNLWEQIREMAFLQIFARAGVNAWNQLFIEVNPQLVPFASRTWATVMTITKKDWQGEIDFERITKPECAVVSLSGVAINSSGDGSSYFSLSPGHAYPHYGSIDVQDKLLVSGQSDANQKAGLYRGWRNNQFPEIQIPLSADIRLIDCFPHSKCAITIDAADTPRGIAYSGNLLPTAVTIVTDPETGYVHREVTFEAETFEDISIDGDIPGSRADVSVPPPASFPPLPDFTPIIPGLGVPVSGGYSKILMLDENKGLVYSEDFNTTAPSGPHWILVNGGLSTLFGSPAKPQYELLTRFEVCPNGSLYAIARDTGDSGSSWLDGGYFLIARAPSIGSAFAVIHDNFLWDSLYAPPSSQSGVMAFGVNPLVSEQVVFLLKGGPVAGGNYGFFIGAAGSYSAGLVNSSLGSGGGNNSTDISYGLGVWVQTKRLGYRVFNADVTAQTTSGDVDNGDPWHIRASTTGRMIVAGDESGANMIITPDNLVTQTPIVDADLHGQTSMRFAACDPTGQVIMARYGFFSARSFDFGASWSSMASQLAVGATVFAYAGPGTSLTSSRWVAFGGTQVYYSENAGSSWANRTGNLGTTIGGIPSIRQIKVIG